MTWKNQIDLHFFRTPQRQPLKAPPMLTKSFSFLSYLALKMFLYWEIRLQGWILYILLNLPVNTASFLWPFIAFPALRALSIWRLFTKFVLPFFYGSGACMNHSYFVDNFYDYVSYIKI